MKPFDIEKAKAGAAVVACIEVAWEEQYASPRGLACTSAASLYRAETKDKAQP